MTSDPGGQPENYQDGHKARVALVTCTGVLELNIDINTLRYTRSVIFVRFNCMLFVLIFSPILVPPRPRVEWMYQIMMLTIILIY